MTEHTGATMVEAADEQIADVTVRTETDGMNQVVRVHATATTESGAKLSYKFMPRTNATISEPKVLAIKSAKRAEAEDLPREEGEYPWSRITMTVPPEVQDAVNERGYTLA